MHKTFYAFVSSWLLALSISAHAQPAARIYRIGILANSASLEANNFNTFYDRLRELGYIQGQNFTVEQRYWDGKVERLPALAAELIAAKCDVIVTSGTEAGIAVKNATTTIPIVLAFGPDVLRLGFVTELARPSGNVTGMTNVGTDLWGRKFELLKDAFPKLTKVAYIWSSTNRGGDVTAEVEKLARVLKLGIQSYDVTEPEKFDHVFQLTKKDGAQAILLGAGGFFGFHQKRVIDLATKYRLPVLYSNVRYVDAGGLMAYAYDRPYQFRRAAEYVDKILKGTKVADLPIERPKKFELVINLKAAKQIGVTIDPSLLARADRVIR